MLEIYPFLLAISIRLEIVLTHVLVPVIAVHAFYAFIGEVLTRIKVFRAALPVERGLSATGQSDATHGEVERRRVAEWGRGDSQLK